MGGDAARQTRASILAFSTAAVALFVQVLVHRIVSAKLLNNYAFFVISLTMLGFALSGVILTFAMKRALGSLENTVGACAVLFALSLVVVSRTFYAATESATNAATDRPAVIAALLSILPLALLYAVPFLFLGLVLGVLLGSPDLSTRRIYAFDLAGSCLGALLVVPAIGSIGVERALILACLVMILVAFGVLWPQARLVRIGGSLSIILLLLALPRVDKIFALRYPEGSMLAATQMPDAVAHVEYVAWDPVARIEVTRVAAPSRQPTLTGENPDFLRRFELQLTQNNYAYTYSVKYDGNLASLTGIEDTIYAAAYQATTVPHPQALVIGVGGGFDILTALRFGASDVTGVEVNGATLDVLQRVYRDYFKAWVDDPRVHLVHAEGRNYLARSKKRFDIIQLSGVDSYSGTPGAANVFSENYLYTAEAFDLYLSRLTDNGILNVMRLEYVPPAHMLRALTTAVESLRRMGIRNPADHVVMLTARSRNFTALLVKRTPFTDSEIDRLRKWTTTVKHFSLSAGRGTEGPVNEYRFFLRLRDSFWEDAYIQSYPWDIRPTRDDWPFFFRSSYWWHLFPADTKVWADIPHFEYSILVLLALASVACLLCIYVPLRFLASSERAAGPLWRYGGYCAGIGLGYLGIEVALLQKLGLLLGHPNYALSIVLATLLLATGLGSLMSASIIGALHHIRFVAYALAAVMLLERTFAFPQLGNWVAAGMGLRVGIVVALVAPVGVLLGVFFPTVLVALKEQAPSFVPWAWGINGIFSVLAPILATAWSMTFGVTSLFVATIPIYVISAILLPRSRPRTT